MKKLILSFCMSVLFTLSLSIAEENEHSNQEFNSLDVNALEIVKHKNTEVEIKEGENRTIYSIHRSKTGKMNKTIKACVVKSKEKDQVFGYTKIVEEANQHYIYNGDDQMISKINDVGMATRRLFEEDGTELGIIKMKFDKDPETSLIFQNSDEIKAVIIKHKNMIKFKSIGTEAETDSFMIWYLCTALR